jgi:FkbM family methyltransferase
LAEEIPPKNGGIDVRRLTKLGLTLLHPRLATSLFQGTAPGVEHLAVLRQLHLRTCIDVGANVGQFSVLIRYLFPEATIIAFEPLQEAADRYQRVMEGGRTTLYRIALGPASTDAEFYVTDRSDSSSLLRPAGGQQKAFGVSTEAVQRVPVRALCEVVSLDRLDHPILMKIDVQGGELGVLSGCGALLEHVDIVYLEASFVALYCDQPLASEVVEFMTSRGFQLRGVFNQAVTRAFGATQADFLFSRALMTRSDAASSTKRTF